MVIEELQQEVDRILEQTGEPVLRPHTLAEDVDAARARVAGPASNQAVAWEVPLSAETFPREVPPLLRPGLPGGVPDAHLRVPGRA